MFGIEGIVIFGMCLFSFVCGMVFMLLCMMIDSLYPESFHIGPPRLKPMPKPRSDYA